ncbi:uncharacterized protein LOC142803415 [Rhipicephalus microplus]|uniref:uncharacterized protein LOC142803415 n=1 Tax=Rhipicephalus microplus TaxID=6941 RepID=UPI002376C48E
MAQKPRGPLRRPRQAFDNVTCIRTVHHLADQDSYYCNPLFEQSQGFELVGSFDGQYPPMPYYNSDADLDVMRAAWLAPQWGIPVSGEGIWPVTFEQMQVAQPQSSHQTAAVLGSAATFSVRDNSCTSRTDASTSSAPSSLDRSDSSESTSRKRADILITTSCDHSDSDRHNSRTNRGSRDLRSPSPKSQEHRMSRGTCAPVLMMVLLMAFLVLVSLVIMAHSNRNMAVISGAGHANAANQIPHMVMSSSATITNVHAPALPVGASKGVKSTCSLEVSRNVSSLRVTRRVAATPMFAAEVTVRKRSSVKKYTRHVKPRKRTTVSLSFGATEDSADIMAFPFQRPTRPMCGDVFYSLCHPNRDQPEFHYRRSVNACVETATDAVHSCNRGANRFASIALCRRSCMRAGHRPAEECYGKPLFTSCARQDVLSSWWFFDGRKCVPWNFPSGGCPADDSAVFRTVHECRTQCLGQLGRSPCGPPRAIACDQRHLKYPFFADSFTSDGRLRCLRSSPSVLRDRRCLTGANRFHTREACMVTCENRPPS